MKKVLVSLAMGCALTAPAIAQATNTDVAQVLHVTVNDYISLAPEADPTARSITYSTPADMVNPNVINAAWTMNCNVKASRSWHVTLQSTAFVRSGTNNNPNISNSVNPENILSSKTTAAAATGLWVAGGFNPVYSTPNSIASQSIGTTGTPFTVAFQIQPGLANQMSGTYDATATMIAALD